ncbi:PREDICTED: formin-like protein CG32138 [Drosophila arizonae]|uniref:Formin-like protein CG32138 n=1 Tax=Drosophila arizonae TaxID=7263 RepID=A0ABM1PWL0_DROAR|nr:PREDICTED: formin-like protein CG32138 [Drosophila arizonae]
MSEQVSYEEECQRAELLGLQPPDKAEFERKRSARLEQQLAEQEAAEAVMLEQQGESLRGAGGKLDELNSILSSTQQRLNRFKQTACGSLTNIFTRGGSLSGASGASASMDVPGYSMEQSAEPPQPPVQRQPQPMAPPTAAEVAAAKAAKRAMMDSQLDKLDSLINKADNAELAMSEQTKQMRRIAK